jgi:hypothetical protein
VAHLDGLVGDRVDGLERRHDLATREALDLEFVIGRLGDIFGYRFGSAIWNVERFRKARRQAPFDLRHRLGDRRRGQGGGGKSRSRCLQKSAAFHDGIPVRLSLSKKCLDRET